MDYAPGGKLAQQKARSGHNLLKGFKIIGLRLRLTRVDKVVFINHIGDSLSLILLVFLQKAWGVYGKKTGIIELKRFRYFATKIKS